MDSNPLMSLLGYSVEGDNGDVLRVLLGLAAELVAGEGGALLVRNPADGELIVAVVAGTANPESLAGTSLGPGDSLVGRVVTTGQARLGTAAGGDLLGRAAQGGSAKNMVAAPMLHEDEVLGVITAWRSASGQPFDAAQTHTFATMASVAAVIVGSGRRLADAEGEAPDLRWDGEAGVAEKELALVELIAELTRADPDRLAATTDLIRAAAALSDE